MFLAILFVKKWVTYDILYKYIKNKNLQKK